MAFGVITDLTEAKLLILYILKYCGAALPKSAIDDIVKSDDLIEHFTYCDAMAELLESGHIIKTDKEKYTFSETGEEAIELFQRRIPFSIRERAMTESTLVLSKLSESEHIIAEYEPNGDGSYTAILKIIGDPETLMEMKLRLPNQLQSEIITSNFRNNPIGIFKEFLKMVAE